MTAIRRIAMLAAALIPAALALAQGGSSQEQPAPQPVSTPPPMRLPDPIPGITPTGAAPGKLEPWRPGGPVTPAPTPPPSDRPTIPPVPLPRPIDDRVIPPRSGQPREPVRDEIERWQRDRALWLEYYNRTRGVWVYSVRTGTLGGWIITPGWAWYDGYAWSSSRPWVGTPSVRPSTPSTWRPAEQPPPVPAVPLTDRQKGDAALKAGDPTAAIDAYTAHLSTHASDAEATRLLALALLDAGRIKDGTSVMLRAYTLDPALASKPLSPALLRGGEGSVRAIAQRVVTSGHSTQSASAFLTAAVLNQAQGNHAAAHRLTERAKTLGLASSVGDPLLAVTEQQRSPK